VLRETLLLSLIGICVGLPAALFSTRLIKDLLFELVPNDPFIIAMASLVMILHCDHRRLSSGAPRGKGRSDGGAAMRMNPMHSPFMEPNQLDHLFREAVAIIDAGDLAGLEHFLATNPMLAQERLAEPGPWLCDKFDGKLPGFFQRPYLLWFVAEDPVRAGHLPKNIAQMAHGIIESAGVKTPRISRSSSTMLFA
jgi:hypothetical protein